MNTSDLAYTTSAVTVIAGFTINELGVIVGIILGIGTFALNWFYQHQRLKLDRGKKDDPSI